MAIFFSFILSFIQIIHSSTLKYPTAFTLNNQKIFVIHSLGIDICDNTYSNNERKLNFEPEMTESQLSKISISKYPSGEFILFIINTLYIFNEEGSIISQKSLYSINGEYYTLSANYIDSGKYFFLFGYIDKDSNKLYLYYCTLDSSDTLETIASLQGYSDYIVFSGLSCELISDSSEFFIMCIYQNYYSYYYISSEKIVVSIFDIDIIL
jgi:hypothetical protein